jgi:hypothetical protein
MRAQRPKTLSKETLAHGASNPRRRAGPSPSTPQELALDRTDLLRSKPAVVGRFMQLMVPILVDVYTASVITPVRVKTLTGLLKAVSFLDGDGLKRVLTVRSSLVEIVTRLTFTAVVCSCSKLRVVDSVF